MSDKEYDDIGRGVGTAIGVTGRLIGGAIQQNRNAKDRQMEQLVEAASKAIEGGDYDTALDHGQRLVKMGGKEAPLLGYVMSGIALRYLERYDEAITLLTKGLEGIRALGHQEGLDKIYGHRGCCYLETNNLANALRDLTALIQLDPGNESGYFWRGIAFRRLGDHQQALEDFNRALSINASDPANYRERGSLYAQMQQPDLALEDYARALKLNPQSSTTYKLRGQTYVAIGDHTRAVADFSQAVALCRSDVEVRQLRIAAYQALGEGAKAAADQRDLAALKASLSSYQAYLATARSLYQAGHTTWYTQEDTRAKVAWAYIVLGVVVGVLPFLCVGIMYSAYGEFAGCLIVLTLLISAGCLAAAFVEPRIKAKRAAASLATLAEHDQQQPAFRQFYERYLSARKSGSLNDLAEQTLAFFEPGGPAQGGLR